MKFTADLFNKKFKFYIEDMTQNDHREKDDKTTGHEGPSMETDASMQEREKRRLLLEFDVRYDKNLAEEQHAYYRRLNLESSFFSILFGFTAMTNLLDFIGGVGYGALGFLSAVFGLASVVFEFANRESYIASAYRKFEDLLGRVRSSTAIDRLDELEQERSNIPFEGFVNEISRAMAYDETVDQMGWECSTPKSDIGWFRIFTRFIWNWGKPGQKPLPKSNDGENETKKSEGDGQDSSSAPENR